MKYIDELIGRYPVLSKNRAEITQCCSALIACFSGGGKLLVCGNGGSCADAEHITGELMKGFLKKRPIPQEQKKEMLEKCPELAGMGLDRLQQGLPAIPLNGAPALNTAFSNDCDPNLIFAQQVCAYGKKGDVFLGISTSGNAKNVCTAAAAARGLGIKTLALAGRDGGKLSEICDVSVVVDETETFKIQELHLPVYHAICAEVEKHFFKE